jgi:TonB family protein
MSRYLMRILLGMFVLCSASAESLGQTAVLTKLSPLTYPPLAKQAHIAGDVELIVALKQDGSVESVSVVSGHPLLQQAALDSAKQSAFECLKCSDGVTLQLVYTFQLVQPKSCCPLTTDTVNDTHPDEPVPRVIQSQNHVTVVDHPLCICSPGPEVGYVQPAGTGDKTYYANAHPYLEEPLEELHKRIPELEELQPATNQRMLPLILEKTAANVDDFFSRMVDLIAREKIKQEVLNRKGSVTAKEQVRDNYLILRHHSTDFGADIIEYRMDSQGNRMDQVGLTKGYLVTFGFALSCNYFSSAFQPESQFRYLGDQRIGSQDTFVVAFAQQPGKARLHVTMTGREGARVDMLMQGIAWVDKSNFQLVRMRTDLLAPHPEIGLDQQTTDVTLSKVQLPDMASPLWLPRDVEVYLRFDSGLGQFYEPRYRNEHHYTDYRRYRVSTKMLVPQ